MEVFREEWEKIKTAYNVALHFTPSWSRVSPILLGLRDLVRQSLTHHPDLSSIALLLVIFYISFVFLVKTWHMAIRSIRFAAKTFVLVSLLLFIYGSFEAAISETPSTFDTIFHGLGSAFDKLSHLVNDNEARIRSGSTRTVGSRGSQRF